MELLIVIVVLGVLASVALPVYSGFVARAKKSEALGFLDAVRASQMRYFAEEATFTTNLTLLDFNPNSDVVAETGGQTRDFSYKGTAVADDKAGFKVIACPKIAADACVDDSTVVAIATEASVTLT